MNIILCDSLRVSKGIFDMTILINRTSHTVNFTVTPNYIAQDAALSLRAHRILTYLLSMPKDWRVIPRQLMKYFGMGRDSVYKALKELRQRGYAVLIRSRRTSTWRIYDSPQSIDSEAVPHAEIVTKPATDAACKNPDFKNSTNQHALQSKQSLPNTEINNYEPAIKQVQQDVVVSNAGTEDRPPIELPPTLKGSQTKVITKLLSNVTPEQAAMVLMIFNTAQKAGKVANPIGYLHALVKASQNGTLTAPENAQQAKPITAGERIAKEKKLREEAQNKAKVDNERHFARLRAMFGSDGVKVLV